LLIAALTIVGGSIWYNNRLAGKLAAEERKKVELWANAYQQINSADKETDITFYFKVIRMNTTVPVILTDESDNILAHRNLDTNRVDNEGYLERQLQQMKEENEPIEIDIGGGEHNYIYYKDSFLLTQLKFYPYIQFLIIAVFLVVAYLAFNTARRAEQNQVGVGMAKETAHQLGTPISSLLGWLEYLKSASKEEYSDIVPNLEKDVKRLEDITERFSKIGSSPEMKSYYLKDVVEKNLDYIKRRSSENISFEYTVPDNLKAAINPDLFGWVLENLFKNAVNAIGKEGTVTIEAWRENGQVLVDVSDTGKGIPKSQQKTIFKPGYTTRDRGWGLGLTLSKRIVEQYHNGKIYVYQSSNVGTTFRIELIATEE
jgi:signal transduction histidine kinase